MTRSSKRSAGVTEVDIVEQPSALLRRQDGAMIIWRDAIVTERRGSWSGAQELEVEITAGPQLPAVVAPGARVKALAYPALVGDPAVGDRVSITCSALARGLGTGGYAMVAALPDRLPQDPAASAGHLVKARYTPLQPMVLGVDDQESAHHDLLREADDLAGMPVVVADLHSALPAIIAGLRSEARDAGQPVPRVAYVMTDGGALPAWFSRSAATLKEAGWIAGTVSVGQAFGGDLEAVTLHTGLLAAKHVLGADVAIVTQGPGNLGTGTRWGFSGVAAGEAINAAAVLGGRPIASLRVSGADARPRHYGISHHSLTAYGRVALAPADVVVPLQDESGEGLSPELAAEIARGAASLVTPAGRHREIPVSIAGLDLALADSPVRLSTMGRGMDQDASPFLAAAAAGRWAARLLAPVPSGIFHLALADDWTAALAAGSYLTSTRNALVSEVGYLHASLPHQVDPVAASFYSDLADSGAVLVEIDVSELDKAGIAVVLEPGNPNQPPGERFPHVYGALPVAAARSTMAWRGSLRASLGEPLGEAR